MAEHRTGKNTENGICRFSNGRRVILRPADMLNPSIPTGEIEVNGLELTILNKAETPPNQIEDSIEVSEDLANLGFFFRKMFFCCSHWFRLRILLTFGYNNQQWSRRFVLPRLSDQWHIAIKSWHMHEDNVPNALSPLVSTVANPFYYMVNGPDLAQCANQLQATCTAREWSVVTYLNYKFSPMDNISWRMEYVDDITGQRTGIKTAYFNYAVGWQHWLSPQIELRPEIAFYNSLNAPAFQQNPAAAPDQPDEHRRESHLAVFSADVVLPLTLQFLLEPGY